ARLRERGVEPTCAAGYSVGQWSAMVAAGMLSLADALRIVRTRADLMNASPATKDGAMLAVIGLPTEKVLAVCDDVTNTDITHSGDCDNDGTFVTVSNYNSLGQLTIAGTRTGVDRAEVALAALSPRKLARLSTSGAWHCQLL